MNVHIRLRTGHWMKSRFASPHTMTSPYIFRDVSEIGKVCQRYSGVRLGTVNPLQLPETWEPDECLPTAFRNVKWEAIQHINQRVSRIYPLPRIRSPTDRYASMLK